MASARPAQLVSLSHVKESSPDPAPAAPKRIAWPGGKITSNKEEATLRFIRKKQSRGEPLTEEQIAVVERSLVRPPGINADATAAEQPPSPSSAWKLSPRSSRTRVLKKLQEAMALKQSREGGPAKRSSPRNAKGKGRKPALSFTTKKPTAGGRVVEKDGGFVTKRFFVKNTALGQKRKLGGQTAPPPAKRTKDNQKKSGGGGGGSGGGGGGKKAKRGLADMLGSTLSTSR